MTEYVGIIPTLIPNTTMQQAYINGAPRSYSIRPIDGYVLHDNEMNMTVIDPDTLETIGLELGYTAWMASCGPAYDFETITTVDGYTAYGSREFFARPASEVPSDQIFSGSNNDHEAM